MNDVFAVGIFSQTWFLTKVKAYHLSVIVSFKSHNACPQNISCPLSKTILPNTKVKQKVKLSCRGSMTQETKFSYEDEEKFFWDNQKIAYGVLRTKTYKKWSCRCFAPMGSIFSLWIVFQHSRSNEQLNCNSSPILNYCKYLQIYHNGPDM